MKRYICNDKASAFARMPSLTHIGVELMDDITNLLPLIDVPEQFENSYTGNKGFDALSIAGDTSNGYFFDKVSRLWFIVGGKYVFFQRYANVNDIFMGSYLYHNSCQLFPISTIRRMLLNRTQ